MKLKDTESLKLWESSELALTKGVYPEFMRTSGLLAANGQGWVSALLRLEEAVCHGVNDLQTLDALGEAAYRGQALEVLLPFQHLYREPLVAVHMARALYLTGHHEATYDYLNLANDSMLKDAIKTLLGVKKDIETSFNSLSKIILNSDGSIKKENSKFEFN